MEGGGASRYGMLFHYHDRLLPDTSIQVVTNPIGGRIEVFQHAVGKPSHAGLIVGM